jgi:type VI secretion system protein ImpH
MAGETWEQTSSVNGGPDSALRDILSRGAATDASAGAARANGDESPAAGGADSSTDAATIGAGAAGGDSAGGTSSAVPEVESAASGGNASGGDASGEPAAPQGPRPVDLPALIARMQEDFLSWNFFAAIRHLECEAPQTPRMGYSSLPEQDVVRFGQIPSLAFAPTDLFSLEPPRRPKAADGTDLPSRFLVNFFGMTGPNGPLPVVFTDYIRNRRLLNEDPTLTEFLDIFHHRMMSLYYRAWADSNQAVAYDRATREGFDRFATYAASLIGLGSEKARRRDPVQDTAKLHFAGRLIAQTRNAEGLEAILGEYFEFDVQIEEFLGQWIDIPREYQCQFKRGAINTCLGAPPADAFGESDASTAIVGTRIWDCLHRFRIRLGPLTFKEYQRMLPGGESLKRLTTWVRQYVGDGLSWDVQLILKAQEAPMTSLGHIGQLGWSTWLRPPKLEHDLTDLILNPQQAA